MESAKLSHEVRNANFPCHENNMVIQKLEEALHWSNVRKNRRVRQGVEGFNKELQGREF